MSASGLSSDRASPHACFQGDNVLNPQLSIWLSNGSKDVLHPALLAPHLGGFAFTLHVAEINSAGILDLDDDLAAVLVLHEEIRQITPLVLLTVNPRDCDTVPLHPFDNMRVSLQAVHHPSFEIALVLLEVPGALSSDSRTGRVC